jgi:glutamine synthetase
MMSILVDPKTTYNSKTPILAEYIWLDGYAHDVELKKEYGTAEIRGKTKILHVEDKQTPIVFPNWGFDGSSTGQAKGHDSDCVLKPVCAIKDPLRPRDDGFSNYIVLTEVFERNGKEHGSNTRAKLRDTEKIFAQDEFMFGIEQEYVLMKGKNPLGWPEDGRDFHEKQGRQYCGVGADKIFGRDIIERHALACLDAGLLFDGINAEVMPGQWEYQIGPGSPLQVADHLVLARYLMSRIAEDYGVNVSLEPKPRKGDWNGSGAHTNFSTKALREGIDYEELKKNIETCLGKDPRSHIAVYGKGITERLTGKHETCSYEQFKVGVSNRGASIRIPWHVDKNKKGYMEDRRPCANIDPYVVIDRIIETVGGIKVLAR